MKRVFKYQFLILTLISVLSLTSYADSGGPLSPEQAAYDVKFYSLDLEIDIENKAIGGSLLCKAEIIDPIDIFLLDLDDVYTVDSVLYKKNEGTFSLVNFDHSEAQLEISLPEMVINGEIVTVQVFYHGIPPQGVHGFTWSETENGEPWIGVSCELDGADIWWPCKDHPSDEPDSISMSYTVPNPLSCISNGKFLGSVDNGNNTSTFDWFISTPINNYNVTINIAEYLLIEDEYSSVIGNTIPFYFWVLPEKYDIALTCMDYFKTEFDFLESICGPFPYGTDKHAYAHTPYPGMEHQTIIAYGSDFNNNYNGYDYIHYHELAHEWWGNHITAKDWADVWIHEGMATYTEALFVEYDQGEEAYFSFMITNRPYNNQSNPLAPREELTATEAFYNLAPYSRGASVMHTLRYHLGDEVFFNLFKRWLYPDPNDLDNTNGRLCRIMSTDDMKDQAEEVTGLELDPFFEVFFREIKYPILHVERKSENTLFTWETETGILLDLDIPVFVNGVEQRIEMNEGVGSSNIAVDDELEIDPKKWILMDTPVITGIDDSNLSSTNYKLEQNYPNPFNQSTTINFTVPEKQFVTLKIYNSGGSEIVTLINQELSQGNHKVNLNRNHLSKGVYYYTLETNDFTETKNFVIN